MEKSLGKADWLRAARIALLHGGVEAVRVEKLARTLRVTKGSFYWHFKNREEILEALLHEWEEERDVISNLFDKKDIRSALEHLFSEVGRRVKASPLGEAPSDAAIFAWAAVSQDVAERVNKEEAIRIRLLKQAFGQDDIAEYVYMAYLGFIVRRQRVPSSVKNFPLLATVSTDLLLNSAPLRKANKKKANKK
jgi:AcrR family transcriptional regulator